MIKTKRIKHVYGEGDEIDTWDALGTVLPGAVSSVTDLVDSIWDLDNTMDNYENPIRRDINALANAEFEGSNNTLLKQYNNFPTATPITDSSFGGKKDIFSSAINNFATGTASGLTAGMGPWSLLLGAGEAGIGALATNIRNNDIDERISKLNKLRTNAQKSMLSNLNYAVNRTDTKNDRWRKQNMMNNMYNYAEGGVLNSKGSTWQSGVNFIDNGGTHETNPHGGVQYGIASDGMPNYVEEEEIIIPTNTGEYAISNRVIPTLQELKDARITDKPEKYVGMTMAEIYRALYDKHGYDKTINREDTKRGLDIFNNRFAQMHEVAKQRETEEKALQRLKEATPEEQNLILQSMGMQEPVEYAKGGEIYIKPNDGEHLLEIGGPTKLFDKNGLIAGDYSKIYSDSRYRPTAEQYGKPEYYPDFYFKNSNNNWKYNPGVEKMYKGLTQDWYDAVSKLPEFETLKHKPKDLKQAIRWLTDDESRNDTIQDWHSFVHSLRFENEDYTMPVGPMSIPRYWKYNWDTGERIPTTIEDFESVPDGWYIDESLNEIGPEDDSGNIYYDYYLSDKEPIKYTNSNKGNVNIYKDYNDNNVSKPIRGNTDLILPIVSGAAWLSDMLGLTNIPDNSNADLIGRSILPPRYIGYNPSGRYVQPILEDTNYLRTVLGNRGTQAIAAAKDLSGGNRGTALSQIAGSNYLTNESIGDLIVKANQANNEDLRQAITLNNAIDQAISKGWLEADSANQNAWDRYSTRYASQREAEAKMREDTANQIAENRSANWNNFMTNLENFFENKRNRTMANESYGKIYGYTVGRDGHTNFKGSTESQKKAFANALGIDVKDINKVEERVDGFYLNGRKIGTLKIQKEG